MGELNTCYESYRSGADSWNTVVSTALPFVERCVKRWYRPPAETTEDVVAEFYPTLERLGRDYTAQGASFESYVLVTFRHFCRAYFRKQRERSELEINLEPNAIECDGLIAHEDPSIDDRYDRNAAGTAAPQSVARFVMKRHLLFTLLKNAPTLDEDELCAACRNLGVPLHYATAFVDVVRAQSDDRTMTRERMRLRRDRHYVMMLRWQSRLRSDHYDRDYAQTRYHLHRRRWQYYIRRLKRQQLSVSNRLVATIVGVPKGTVDSALFTMARRLERGEIAVYVCNDDVSPGEQQQPQKSRNRRYRPGAE